MSYLGHSTDIAENPTVKMLRMLEALENADTSVTLGRAPTLRGRAMSVASVIRPDPYSGEYKITW